MKTMRLWMCVVCGLLFASGLYARKTGVLDEIVFGHSVSTQFRASPFERALFSALNRVSLKN